ncbi:MAG: prepilin-type N-terminal cleavage/methylation domain-containing protein [Candidatus Omnitrophica bacterium]|nr:prepilin-type N-terminal cleavage/methylation domain-containing protein [Candidatus Omnitrophota bacterium]MDD5351735.1 prepilin-type N-terminal cleavage/methylation domain-containing protein [Candidatus Omnitrophota bacterium]MDD5550946.1 prepilin-type N-terminal cleavage/methylation domain-containing protein [Candidatus Omnitrophota bacterium]
MEEKRFPKKGFTLMELIIVIVVIGILVSLAWPTYIKVIEKSRVTEAKNMLSAIRQSQIRYYAQYLRYSTSANTIDIIIPGVPEKKYFTCTPTYTTGVERIGRAVRTTLDKPAGIGTYIIYIYENGTFSISSGYEYLL